MNYQETSTEKLIDLIITEVGVPIPNYNYDTKKFQVRIPLNVRFSGDEGEGIVGIEEIGATETFREACIEILTWYNSIK
jgi:hypothetical protein